MSVTKEARESKDVWTIGKVTRFVNQLLYDAFWRTHYYHSSTNAVNNIISVTEVTQCLRLSYYFRKMPKVVPNMLFVLAGASFHYLITKEAKRYGMEREKSKCLVVVLSNENNEKEEVRICGRTDLIDPSTSTLFEFKFVNKVPEKDIYPEHKQQVCFYKHLFKVDHVYIVYFARKDKGGIPEIKAFQVDSCSENEYKDMIRRAVFLYKCLKNNILPKPEKWYQFCWMCPYWIECKNNKKPEENNGGGNGKQ